MLIQAVTPGATVVEGVVSTGTKWTDCDISYSAINLEIYFFLSQQAKNTKVVYFHLN